MLPEIQDEGWMEIELVWGRRRATPTEHNGNLESRFWTTAESTLKQNRCRQYSLAKVMRHYSATSVQRCYNIPCLVFCDDFLLVGHSYHTV